MAKPPAAPRPRVIGTTLLGVVAASSIGGCQTAPGDEAGARARAAAERSAISVAESDAGLDEVTSIAVEGDTIVVGTAGGLVRLDPATASVTTWLARPGISHALVSDVAVAADGTIWTSHRSPAPAEDELVEAGAGVGKTGAAAPRRGGVRAFRADGSVAAWFSEDGLGDDDVVGLFVRGSEVVAAAGSDLAVLDAAQAGAVFRRGAAEATRRALVVDATSLSPPRSVIEFRPPGERIVCVAPAGNATLFGTTHGLFRQDGAGLTRYEIPCRAGRQLASMVVAVAAWDGSGLAASLGVRAPDGSWAPGGVFVVDSVGRGQCLAPGVDVPDAPSLDVAADATSIYLATYEGLTRIVGNRVELLDKDRGAPPLAVTAACADGHGGCWAGTWGGGLLHVQGDTWRLYGLGDPSGQARIVDGALH